MQHLLSRHPQITIHGQEPRDLNWGSWLEAVVNGARFARESNARLDYAEPHYAGAVDPRLAAERFLEFVRTFLSADGDSVRWGLKSLTECRVCVEPILKVWPGTRWVVCLREPFRTIESLRNTYDTGERHSLELVCRWWCEAVEFSRTEPNAKLVLFDQLTTAESRRRMTAELFDFVGENATAEVWEFVEEWPVVHKVVPDDERKYLLGEAERSAMLESNPQFARLVEELGYLCREESGR